MTHDSAEEGTDLLASSNSLAPPSPFTCPSCGGSLWKVESGKLLRFYCHLGHKFTQHSLRAEKLDRLEAALWAAVRSLEEGEALCRHMAQRSRNSKLAGLAEGFERDANIAAARADIIRGVLLTDDLKELERRGRLLRTAPRPAKSAGRRRTSRQKKSRADD